MKISLLTTLLATLLVSVSMAETPRKGITPVRDTRKGGNLASSPGAIVLPYQGGPVMLGAVTVYQIYYGNWAGTIAKDSQVLLSYFINHISSTEWFNIEKEYYMVDSTKKKHYITGPIKTGNSTTDKYSEGSSLSTNSIGSIVSHALSIKALPVDYNGIYVVYTSSDVTVDGFCTS